MLIVLSDYCALVYVLCFVHCMFIAKFELLKKQINTEPNDLLFLEPFLQLNEGKTSFCRALIVFISINYFGLNSKVNFYIS